MSKRLLYGLLASTAASVGGWYWRRRSQLKNLNSRRDRGVTVYENHARPSGL